MTISLKDAVDIAIEQHRAANFCVDALPAAIRTLHLISALEFEVSMGGIAGWLLNASGTHARETVDALTEVGAASCADLLTRALNVFPGGAPAEPASERKRQIEALGLRAESLWDELGTELLDWPDDLDGLLTEYVAAHESDFYRVAPS